MTPADLDAVMALADDIHADHPEGRAVFADRLALFAAGCAVLETGGRILGYCVAHPIRQGHPAPLDSVLGALAADADCLHLHDLALLPEARGAGHPA
ncbi:MAG TPA: GNAT family N-acetyltransferase, partial [Candidatus Omnitrophota bacterium]|nr:GNAT family N-acetyltransferase [Candidatus Omnitrophota bacterium]